MATKKESAKARGKTTKRASKAPAAKPAPKKPAPKAPVPKGSVRKASPAKAATAKPAPSKTPGSKSAGSKSSGSKPAPAKSAPSKTGPAKSAASKATASKSRPAPTAKRPARPAVKTMPESPIETSASISAAQPVAAAAPEQPAVALAQGAPRPEVRHDAQSEGNAAAVPGSLDELPTEELWTRYRKEANRVGEKGSRKLDELRNNLMERHYPLVRYIAERLLQTLPKSIELDDLISAGLFGLMDAIRGFDTGRGIKFKTYCSTRIRGSILDQLRSQDWVPRLVRLKAGRIERALQKLTGEYGREPTHSELAKVLELEHSELAKEMEEARAKTMFSLSEKWEDGDDDGALEKVEILEDRTAVDPVHEINKRDLMGYITRSLTHKERFIIEQYYHYGHTMREIGEMLTLTESRVCQIHSNVMGRLKTLLSQKQDSLLT